VRRGDHLTNILAAKGQRWRHLCDDPRDGNGPLPFHVAGLLLPPWATPPAASYCRDGISKLKPSVPTRASGRTDDLASATGTCRLSPHRGCQAGSMAFSIPGTVASLEPSALTM
jgi:hypothetical protein